MSITWRYRTVNIHCTKRSKWRMGTTHAVCAMIFFYLVIVHLSRKSQTGQSGCVWIPMKRGTKSFGGTPRVGVPLGSKEFLVRIGTKIGRNLLPKKRGPRPKHGPDGLDPGEGGPSAISVIRQPFRN
jgi:hypothetical protein